MLDNERSLLLSLRLSRELVSGQSVNLTLLVENLSDAPLQLCFGLELASAG
jgi:hypothetical protein